MYEYTFLVPITVTKRNNDYSIAHTKRSPGCYVVHATMLVNAPGGAMTLQA